jgi:hypothetical protein
MIHKEPRASQVCIAFQAEAVIQVDRASLCNSMVISTV